MTTPESVPVVVIGAGPTGVVVASLLAQRGVHCVVLERYDEIYPLPRAVHADDEVVRILQQLGLDQEFAAISRPATGLRLVDDRRQVLAEFRRGGGENGHPQSNLFDQPDLERLLRRKMAALDVDLRCGAEVVSLDQGDEGVVVTYRDPTTGAMQGVHAQFVLGCDGANSSVRTMIGSRLLDLRFEERWLVIDVDCPVRLDVWDGVEQVCDPRRAATAMRVGEQRYRFEFRLLGGEQVDALIDPDTLATLLAPWTGTVPRKELRVLRSASYTFRARVADRWQVGRILLLGDAAHLTPPFIGQGMGAGLRDASNLAWKLAAVLLQGADPALLATYELERKPAARALIRSAVLVGWAMTGGHGVSAAVRRRLLAVVGRTPGATRSLARTTMPRLGSSKLMNAPRSPGLLRRRDPSGRLCPQPWVTDAQGESVRLDALLGNGFAIIADGPTAGTADLEAKLGPVVTVDVRTVGSPQLVAWLRAAGARSVLVRPDRIVAAAWPRNPAWQRRRSHAAAKFVCALLTRPPGPWASASLWE